VRAAWSAAEPGYHQVLAMHAFGLEECGEYEAAERAARRALELEPTEMKGRPRAGLRAIAGFERRAPLTNHLSWHAALFHLQENRPEAALRVYERSMRLGEIPHLLDASSLLWRLHLAGFDVRDWFPAVAEAWQPHADDGYCSFNDLHAMMAFVAARRWSAAERVIAAMQRRLLRTSGANYEMTRAVGLPAARALPPVAHKLGGSHAQRDILQITRAAAAARRSRFLLAA